MAATNQSIKDAFALSGNKPAVTNGHLTRLQAVVDDELGITGSTADDFWDATYEYWKGRVLHREDSIAADVAQNARPTEL